MNPDFIQRIPKQLLAPLVAYVQTGVPLGGFLRAVVANDLMGAVNPCRRRQPGRPAGDLLVYLQFLSREVFREW